MTTEIFSKLLNECRKFAANEIRETALDADLSSDTDWALRIWKKSIQLDLPFLAIPECFQGGGCTPLECALILDHLAGECAGIASVYAHHFVTCVSLLMADVEHQKRLFSRLTAENALPVITSVIFPQEPDDNSLKWEEKNGSLILNGSSRITGGISLAGGFIIFLTSAGNPDKTQSVWIGRSEKGVTTDEPLQLPGLKVNPFGSIRFHDVKIVNENIIAFGQTAEKMLATSRSAFYGFVSAMAVGAARRSVEKALDYAKARYQFGNQIIHHQEIQRMLGNMQMKLNAGTAAYRQSFEDQRDQPPFLKPDAALAKIFCTDSAMEIVTDAIQIHGGYGYMHEYGIEKIMRDVKVLQLLGGTNPYLKVRHIAERV